MTKQAGDLRAELAAGATPNPAGAPRTGGRRSPRLLPRALLRLCVAAALSAPQEMRRAALACAVACVTSAAAQGFVEWRVTSVFERLLVTLGVPMQPGAFGSAFDAGRCELHHEKLFRGYLQPGFDALLSKDDAVW